VVRIGYLAIIAGKVAPQAARLPPASLALPTPLLLRQPPPLPPAPPNGWSSPSSSPPILQGRCSVRRRLSKATTVAGMAGRYSWA
jgi:hypothetical protein